MQYTLRISVLRPDRVHSGQFKELFRQVIVLDDSLSFDYQKVTEVLHILYSGDILVQYSVFNY